MELTAKALTNSLFENYQGLKSGVLDIGQATALNKTANQILSVVRVRLQVSKQSARSIPKDIITFSEK